MTIKRAAAIMLGLLLSACGDAPSNGVADNRMPAPAANDGAPASINAAEANLAASAINNVATAEIGQAAADWAGRYEGASDPGEIGVAIQRGGVSNRYRVTIDVGAQGCGGQASGSATVDGERMTLTAVSEDVPDRQCRITLTRNGRSLRVEEGEGCLPFHGASCGFDGTVTRR